MLRHRLRLFDAVVSPTMKYASGTWRLTKEHERMIQSTQRKMFRLIIQTKRHKKIVKKKDETQEKDDTQDVSSTEDAVQDTRHTGHLGDREEDGKTISTNSSNSKKTRPKTLRKAKTNHGSNQRKTVENGFYLKKTTQ